LPDGLSSQERDTQVERRQVAELREVMNVDQAARYLGVSPDTLYKYLSEGRLPAFKLGNRWRLKKSTLDHWMEKQSTPRGSGSRGRIRAVARSSGK
jgi:excisionase family DNA binding protein